MPLCGGVRPAAGKNAEAFFHCFSLLRKLFLGEFDMAVDEAKIREFEALSFEDGMARLEEIVRNMEGGKVPLEQMIANFEEGSALAAVCHRKLASLKRKIDILQKNPAGGTMWKNMDVSENGDGESGNPA